MSTSVSPSENKTYAVASVCRIWKLSRATLYRQRVWAHATRPATPKRPGPQGAASDADLVAAIRKVLANSPFHGEGYRKIWARLRLEQLTPMALAA